MNKKLWIFSTAVITVVITAAVISSICKQKEKRDKKLAVVSDAGYETAFDVHYPLKHNRPGKKARS